MLAANGQQTTTRTEQMLQNLNEIERMLETEARSYDHVRLDRSASAKRIFKYSLIMFKLKLSVNSQLYPHLTLALDEFSMSEFRKCFKDNERRQHALHLFDVILSNRVANVIK